MKRIAGLAGAVVASAVLAVSIVPSAAADVREPRVPVGMSSSGVVPGAASTASAWSAARDIPDIEWPPPGVEPPGHSRETLLEFAEAMGQTPGHLVPPDGAGGRQSALDRVGR